MGAAISLHTVIMEGGQAHMVMVTEQCFVGKLKIIFTVCLSQN